MYRAAPRFARAAAPKRDGGNVIVRLGAAPRAAGLSCEQFQEHWGGEHGGLAGQIDGVRAYVQNHAVLAEGWPLLPYPGFDACSEIEFDSVQAMDDAFASEFYTNAVVADEQVMIDKTRFSLLLAERRVLSPGKPPPDAVKLLTFLALAPGATPDALAAGLEGPYREAIAEDSTGLHHEQLLESPGAHEGHAPACCTAIDLLWFPTEGDALDFVTGPAGQRARFALTGLAFGVERLIARPVRII